MTEIKELIIPEAITQFGAGLEELMKSVTPKTPQKARKAAYEHAEQILKRQLSVLKSEYEKKIVDELPKHLTDDERFIWEGINMVRERARTYYTSKAFEGRSGVNMDDEFDDMTLRAVVTGTTYRGYGEAAWADAFKRVTDYAVWTEEYQRQADMINAQLKAIKAALYQNTNSDRLEEKKDELMGKITQLLRPTTLALSSGNGS